MSMTHVVSRALGAAALAATLVTAGTAGAAPQAPERPVPGWSSPGPPTYRMVDPGTQPTAPPSIAAPRRTITSDVVWRRGKLYLRGDVESYSNRVVAVQKRRCDSCRWRRHELTRTGKWGRFRSAINAPKQGSTFWRAKVAPSDGYARSFSAVWETYY